ncbi:unnamed protein product [Thelazia callipaeda]|uniref:Nucleic-acid-binding protein from transposon X-element n=1 Tax=Thelazia callipaeda TaxID=103827 RepID=A0A0N5D8W8_THECL|nr:unnamed protein product [Thelazia callipaeda]
MCFRTKEKAKNGRNKQQNRKTKTLDEKEETKVGHNDGISHQVVLVVKTVRDMEYHSLEMIFVVLHSVKYSTVPAISPTSKYNQCNICTGRLLHTSNACNNSTPKGTDKRHAKNKSRKPTADFIVADARKIESDEKRSETNDVKQEESDEVQPQFHNSFIAEYTQSDTSESKASVSGQSESVIFDNTLDGVPTDMPEYHPK